MIYVSPTALQLGDTFDASTAVNTLDNTITFPSPVNLETGDQVVYQPASGSMAVGGLTAGKVYVVNVDYPTTIMLQDPTVTYAPLQSFTGSNVSNTQFR